MEALCFLLQLMMSTGFGLVLPYDLHPDSNDQLQFDSEYEHLEFALDIAKLLDEMKVDPTEKYVLVSETEFAEAVKTLYEVHHTNENLMRVVELEMAIKTARWYYYIYITVCAFLGGILFGFLLIGAFIFYELKIRSCNGIMFFAILLTLTAFFNYYVITYFHQIHFLLLTQP